VGFEGGPTGDNPNGLMAESMDLKGYISTMVMPDAIVPPERLDLKSVTEDRTYFILTGPYRA